jgi:hypothetical protein
VASPPVIGWNLHRKTSPRNFKELHCDFWKIEQSHHNYQQCHSGEHHAVAAQAQILEGVEAEAAGDLELVEVSNVKAHRRTITDWWAGRGGFQQRDNGPPADVLGKISFLLGNFSCKDNGAACSLALSSFP